MNIFTRVFSIFLFVSVNALCASSQTASIQWQKTLGGTDYDQGLSVVQTADGGFITAGIATSTNGDVTGNHGFGDVWIAKLTSLGALQWQKSLGGSADDGGFSIIQTSDLNYVIAGTSTSTNGDVTVNHGFVDFWIVKVNSSGTVLWQKSFGGSSVDIPYDIHETSDGGLIVAGYTVSNDGDVTGNHGFEDFWIIKLTATGTLQWQQTFGGSQDERAFTISETTDGGFIAGGYTRSTDGDVTNNHGDYDYWIVKLSSTGALQWEKTLGGSLSDQGHGVQQTADGGFITSGFTASSDGDVSVNHGFEDLWLVKLDNAGGLLWEKSLGGTGVDQAYQVKEVPAGGFIAVGSSFSLDGDVTGNHGGYDYWVVRTDNNGNIIWEKSLGGSSVEEAFSVSPTTGNGFIIGGGTLSNDGNVTNNHGDFDYWIIKLNETTAGPLPVELVNFEAVNSSNKNTLKWTTASENNNDYFDLERKCGNEEFAVVTRVEGHGTTTAMNKYAFEDYSIKGGTTYYYRLKQVDKDGKFTYSQVLRVEAKANFTGIKIYPNPSANFFTIYSAIEKGQLDIFDMLGKRVYSRRFDSFNGQSLSLNVAPGIYSLRLSDGVRIFTEKLLIR